MYSVVEFTDQREVEVVPDDWIVGEMCWYPNYKSSENIRKAIKRRETPKKETFTMFKARVFGSYGKFSNNFMTFIVK